MSALPKGWAITTLGELPWGSGGTPKTGVTEFYDGDIPWATIGDLNEGLVTDTKTKISEQGLKNSSAKWVEPGTILVAMYGASIGKLGIAGCRLTTNQAIAFTNPAPLDGRYIFHYLRFKKPELVALGQGGAQPNISQAVLKQFPLLVAPLGEQHRIVAKLDALFARSRVVKASLNRLPELLDRLRQSILAAAFSGRLGIGPDAKHEQPETPSSLPSGWRVVRLEHLIQTGPTNGFSPESNTEGRGIRTLKLSATTSGRMVLDEITTKFVDVQIEAGSSYWLNPGDLLIQRSNTIEYVGTAAIFNGAANSYIYPDLMMKVRITDPILREWVWRYLNSPHARAYFRANATGTAGSMPKINGAVVRGLEVPVPPPAELAAWVKRIEQALAPLDRLEVMVAAQKLKLEALTRQLLAQAFCGELVPQDPNDEPASVLLERIRAEREASQPVKRKRGASTSTPAKSRTSKRAP